MFRPRPVAALAIFCTVLVLVIWASVILQLRSERESAVAHALHETTGFARVFEEHVLRTLRAAEFVLSHIESEYREAGTKLDLRRFAERHGPLLDPYTVVSITDRRGDLKLASFPFGPTNYADRESFRHHASEDTGRMYVSRPQVGTLTGKATLFLSRRLNRPDGGFDGVVAIGLDATYLSRFYDQVDLGKDGVIVLSGDDGIIRARKSNDDVSVGQDLSGFGTFRAMRTRRTGHFTAVETLDGVRRIFAYRVMEAYPLIVQVGMSEAVMLGPYHRMRNQLVIWAGLITAFAVLFAGLVSAQAGQQARYARALARSEARYRSFIDATSRIVWSANDAGVVVEDSPTWRAYTGQQWTHYSGSGWLDAVHPEDRARVAAWWQQTLSQRSACEAEYRLLGGDGGYRTFRCRAVPVLRRGGSVREWVAGLEDLTEEKRTRDALDASRRHQQDILNAIYAFVGLFARDGVLVAANVAPFAGARGEGSLPVGQPFWDGYWWSYSAAVQRRLKAAMARAAEGEIVRYDEVIRAAPDIYLTVDIQFGPLRDAAGDVVEIVAFAVDITERKKAEAERAHLAHIVQTSDDAIVSRSLDHVVLSWNAGAERLFGYTADEVIGREMALLIAPDGMDRYLRLRALSSNGKPPPPHENVCMAKDGRRIDVWVSASEVHDERGELVAISLILRDITEQKKLEAQQRLAASVLASAAEGVMIMDRNRNIVAVNPAFTEITGFTPEDAIGKDRRLLSSAAHPSSGYDAVWQAVEETGRWQGEVWDRRKNGELYCELLSVTAVRDDAGEVVHHCAIIMDITQRKAAEAELKRLNAELEDRVAARTRQLESANKELAAFSYSVSHDLRAPVRAIEGFSALVVSKAAGRVDSETLKRLHRIRENAQRMGLLIDDLLRLSRVSQRELDRRDFDLSSLASEVVNNLRRMEAHRAVEVSVQLGMITNGDPALVQLVLENLIGNAWKFTSRAEQARVEVGREDGLPYPVYYVRDNGAGFDMQYADKLFNAFQRLHHREDFEGTGIGLSIVHRVIVKHGGRIWADARVGQGACFYFTLG